jgi:peptide/nickel transport system permease protein
MSPAVADTATGATAAEDRSPRLSAPGRSQQRLTTISAHAGQSLVVAFVVVVLTFLMVRLTPGSAVSAITGTHGTNQSRAALLAQFHLNEPLVRQFGSYLSDLAHGNLGSSLIQQGRPVLDIIGSTLPVTLSLIAATIVVACLLGIPLGLLAAISTHRSVDVAVRGALSLLLASPPFFLGLLLILGPALALGWLPAGGWSGDWPANLRFLVLPSVALAGYLIPLIGRAVRQAAMEAMADLWYEAALARGLPGRTLVIRHVLPNSLLPVVTLVGMNAGALIAGAVVIESVFGVPGIGQELITAIELRDYPVIQGIVLVTALVVVLCNLLADVGYRFVDPRTARS